MTFAAPEKTWVGKCEPVVQSEVAELYWSSDINAAEIAEAYGIQRVNFVATQAGPSVLKGRTCTRCCGSIIVRSRAQALERLTRRSLTSPNGAVCDSCQKSEQSASFRQWQAQDETRRARARLLSAMPYKDYLQTPEWQARRRQALHRSKLRCQTCAGSGELHVHHRTYARRGNERADDLIVLCAACHQLFHQNGRLADGGLAA